VDKQLVRKEVWPDNQWKGGQRVRKRLPGMGTWFGKVGKWFRAKMRRSGKERRRVDGKTSV
jgi:hypothetical protein